MSIPAGHLAAIWRAETTKLFTRSSARAGLLVAALVALAALLMLWWVSSSAMVVNGAAVSEILVETRNAPGALRWGLLTRNFFVLRAFLILVGAQAVAGELQARTLREDLLRPVPRWAVVAAKWGALATWIAATLGVAWVVGALGGSLLLGTGGPWGEVALGYVATWACDVGFASLVMAISLAVRGVAGTVMGVFLFLVLDTFLGWGLRVLEWAAGIDVIRQSAGALAWVLDVVAKANPWLPSSAFAAWRGVSPDLPWVWQSFVALLLVTAVAMIATERQLARLDVP